MEFEKRKRAALATMVSPEPDKSPKGDIDKPIIPLLKTLNSHPSYFTTSSCSGRISILSTPTAAAAGVKKKAKGGNWVFISHDLADPDSVENLIFPPLDPARKSTEVDRQENLVFRFEPLIIAVECKDPISAQKLVSLAISCGFRESGITSLNAKRVIVAVRCSIRLEVPLGDTHKIAVSREYLAYLVGVANEKMAANRKRTDGLHEALLKNGFVGEPKADECGRFLDPDQDSGHRDCPMSNGGAEAIGLTREATDDTCNGSLGLPGPSLAITRMAITGEPVENLHLWGHSACNLEASGRPGSVLVFGGFGGTGRHARRNDSWVLDTVSGQLESLDCSNTPSPRLGHVACLIGERMFVIGGRADPGNVLNDVWALNTKTNEWRRLECGGIEFPHSHRHAAAAIGPKIYVFGGIQNGAVSSTMYVLDTDDLSWAQVTVRGKPPSPRHSHTMVTYGPRLFLFGGYDGEKPLGDLYSFYVGLRVWKREKTTGHGPYARFSHAMFVYGDFIGVVGGCPIKQHYQELSLLDVGSRRWARVKLDSVGEDLFVRSTAAVVAGDLVVVGGGASCYAFGTKFSGPVKVGLGPSGRTRDEPDRGPRNVVPSHSVLRVDKKHAKAAKDVLKRFGWLDTGRGVYMGDDGAHVSFPVMKEFVGPYAACGEELPVGGSTAAAAALELLAALGAVAHADHVVKVRKASRRRRPPPEAVREAVGDLVRRRGLPETLLEEIPARWERLGDIVVLPVTSFKGSVWDSFGNELWLTVADSLGARRLARQGRVSSAGTRDSGLELLVGGNGWVDHRENRVVYSFDATKCMFSWGNLSEKLRMGRLDCRHEVVVDLFAGIGYFTLPFLVRANAKRVYACEWNPHAVAALRRNLEANGVADRCVVLEGDNRVTAPKGVADRVSLGLLPSSEGSWVTAVRALRSKGGVLHVHGNVKDSEEDLWAENVAKSILEIVKSEGYDWDVSVEHLERVKWYAPHVRHLVVDIRCIRIET